jgi:hypothetical protein
VPAPGTAEMIDLAHSRRNRPSNTRGATGHNGASGGRTPRQGSSTDQPSSEEGEPPAGGSVHPAGAAHEPERVAEEQWPPKAADLAAEDASPEAEHAEPPTSRASGHRSASREQEFSRLGMVLGFIERGVAAGKTVDEKRKLLRAYTYFPAVVALVALILCCGAGIITVRGLEHMSWPLALAFLAVAVLLATALIVAGSRRDRRRAERKNGDDSGD